MTRTVRMGAFAVALVVGGSTGWRMIPDACTLLSVQEAIAIIGPPLALGHHESNATFSTCVYSRASASPGVLPNDVEIHYWAMSDVPTAQAKFQKVVHPGPMAGTTVTSVSGLGDEADVKRTPSYQMNSIEFRRGVSIVSIGVNPLVSDSALIAAGKKALSRL